MSDPNSHTIDPEAPELHLPNRSRLMAYVLLLPGVFFGVHRFYVGKWLTGLLYIPGLFLMLLMADTLPEDVLLEVIGLIYLLVLLGDGWFLGSWVVEFNRRIMIEYEMFPERYQIEDAEHIAPWARGRAKKVKLGFIASRVRWSRNYIFFFLLPLINGIAASEFESVELLMIPIVILIIIGLIGSLDKTLSRYPTIQEIPGVGQALGRVDAMRKLYWEKEPNVMGAFIGLFMRAGKEYKPYWGIASIVFATVIISGLMSYDVNSAYIEPYVAAEIVVFTAVFAAIVILVNLVPVTALSFHYSLSGKTTRLGFMTLLAIIATVIGFKADQMLSSEEINDGSGAIPTYLSSTRLDERMKNTDFQNELRKKMTFFLSYYTEHTTSDPLGYVLSDLLSKLAPNDESTAFGVIVRDRWMAITYHHDKGKCFINRRVTDITGRRVLIQREAEQKLQEENIKLNKDGKDTLLLENLFSGPFSILAVTPLPNDENKKNHILGLMAIHDGAPLQLAKAMANKKTYYQWTDMMIPKQPNQVNYIPESCMYPTNDPNS